MDIRCGSCRKLFRVSDDKIAGAGIKFKCSKCGEYVKITNEDFDNYKLASATAGILTMPEQKPQPAPIKPSPAPKVDERVIPPQPAPPAQAAPPAFDFGDAAPAEPRVEEPFVAPDFSAELLSVPQSEIGPEPKPEPKPAIEPQPKTVLELTPNHELVAPEAPAATAPVAPAPKPAPEPKRPVAPPVVEKPVSLPRPSIAPRPAPVHVAAETLVHPFTSGVTTGALAGLGCAIPVILLMLLAFGIVSKFVPLLSGMPVMYIVALASASFIGLGILTGVIIAVAQALAQKKLFFLLNTLIGAGFGAILGVVHSSALSLSMGTGLQMITIIGGVINGGIFGFLLSISVVIVRAIMLSAKTESFAGRLSGMAMAGVIFATALFGFTVYGELTLFSKMKTSAENATGEFKDMSSTEGLQVQNSSGYIDTVNSDLVLTGVVENATDGERHAWYLVADVYDAQGAVLIRAKMLNGKQLYSGRDYEILARRGVNVQELQVRSLKDQGTIIPPRGMVNFELRIMEPPVGIASFIVTLQPFDPIQMFKEMAEELKEKQPQQ